MWLTFKEELKYLFSKKTKIVEFLVLLLIPFTYGFLYMNAYWQPFKNADELKIIVINKDIGDTTKPNAKSVGQKFTEAIKRRDIYAGDQKYTVATQDASDIYKNKSNEEIEKLVNSGKYSAAIVIPKTFTQDVNAIRKVFNIDKISDVTEAIKAVAGDEVKELVAQVKSGTIDFATAIQQFVSKNFTNPKFSAVLPQLLQLGNLSNSIDILQILKQTKLHFGVSNQEHNIQFYNDYKNSYLAGEMTNFGTGLKDILLQMTLSTTGFDSGIYDSISNMFKTATDKTNLIKYTPVGGNLTTYGKGLSPYFISIAIWAGTLSMIFLFKNERRGKAKGVPTVRHYFGKWLVWLLTGWAQTTILLTAVTLQGVHLPGINQYQLFLWGYFVSAVFSTFVMSIVFSIRFGDIGEFVIVIILVLQLISSSGTFPVEMQNIIFKIVHPIAPFTYSIDGIRELLYQPDTVNILIDTAILLAFPFITIPIALTLNYYFDKKNGVKLKGTNKMEYKSFEIEVGDL